MKTIYLIGGTMGVGKTTVGQILKGRLKKAVFLDGDWCWDADPFQVTDETKAMVMDNICHLLNNFIHCTTYENIIFCWVMHQQAIIDRILEKLDIEGHDVKTVSLVCSSEALAARLNADISAGLRSGDIVERSAGRLPLYEKLKTEKIDVSIISASEAAEIIASL